MDMILSGPERFLAQGETISTLEVLREQGEPLSSRQWQILHEVSLIKLQELAQRCSDDL